MSALAEEAPEQLLPSLLPHGESGGNSPSGAEADLDYTLLPSPYTAGFSLKGLVMWAPSFQLGFAKGTLDLLEANFGGPAKRPWPHPERRVEQINEHERVVLITRPDPEMGVESSEAIVDIRRTGLGEIDIGSALMLHEETAKQNPENFTVTLTMPGINTRGRTLPIYEALGQSLEATAIEDLELIHKLTHELNDGGRVYLGGVSLGSYMTILKAQINAAADARKQLTIVGVDLVADAVAACGDIRPEHKFRDISDEELRKGLNKKFWPHVGWQIPVMGARHPKQAGRFVASMGEYVLKPWLMPNRLAAISGNYDGVNEGLEWDKTLEVFRAHPTNVVGGEDDPLVQGLLAQKVKLAELAPDTKLRIIKGLGHLMTFNVEYVASLLREMNNERAGPKLTLVT